MYDSDPQLMNLAQCLLRWMELEDPRVKDFFDTMRERTGMTNEQILEGIQVIAHTGMRI